MHEGNAPDLPERIPHLHDPAAFDPHIGVLDVDGAESGATPNLYVQNLYLTDITVAESDVDGKEDVSSAIRVHVDGGVGKRALLAPGAGSAETVTTTTSGKLDLGGATGNDTKRDVPNNYSWTDGQATELVYGSDKPSQTAYDMNNKMAAAASNGIYPQNDGVGHLTGGRALGTTAAAYDADQLTIHFTVFLEGWQALDPDGDGAKTASTLWSSTAHIGAKFNIGMSFGVTTLD